MSDARASNGFNIAKIGRRDIRLTSADHGVQITMSGRGGHCYPTTTLRDRSHP